jgi:hypothetical protein
LHLTVNTSRGNIVLSDCCFKYENVEQLQPTGIAESLEECLNTLTLYPGGHKTIAVVGVAVVQASRSHAN